MRDKDATTTRRVDAQNVRGGLVDSDYLGGHDTRAIVGPHRK